MARSALSAAHLFSHLPEKLTSRLFARSRPVKLAPDQVLFLAGDPGDGCYHVERGLLKVSVASPAGGERILAILGPGALVGELAIVDGQPRSASVSAIRES
ncbi:MAG TPA: cyclic nucleotide-binding domain-containing protein, partial [Xanthobacteraceae bacterium]|nr:cyclic nucleotide-binding domain-containing protein [Xanthobacteraceae bacterium]